MRKKIKKIIKEAYKDSMPDQRSTTDQLQDLYEIAIYMKKYDAADFLFKHISGSVFNKEKDCLNLFEYRRRKHGKEKNI